MFKIEEMWTVQDIYEEMCALDTRLCEVEARLDEAESAELQQQSAVDVCVILSEIESVPVNEIDVATTAAATAMGEVPSCGGSRDGCSSVDVVG